PEVASVGNRDAQVADRPTEGIGRTGAAVEGGALCHPTHGSPNPRTAHSGAPRERTAVPPAPASGTTSQLHHTDPRCHDALSRGRRMTPPGVPTTRIEDRCPRPRRDLASSFPGRPSAMTPDSRAARPV